MYVVLQVPLSFSHTVSSPECCASFVLAFVGTSLTHALCVKALEKQKGVAGVSHISFDGASSFIPCDVLQTRNLKGSQTKAESSIPCHL